MGVPAAKQAPLKNSFLLYTKASPRYCQNLAENCYSFNPGNQYFRKKQRDFWCLKNNISRQRHGDHSCLKQYGELHQETALELRTLYIFSRHRLNLSSMRCMFWKIETNWCARAGKAEPSANWYAKHAWRYRNNCRQRCCGGGKVFGLLLANILSSV